MPASSCNKLIILLAAALAAACSSLTEQAQRYAADQGLSDSLISTAHFQHRLFRKTGQPTERLHIYIEGDGRPWLRGQFVADDPTPRTPLALQLMAAVPYTAVYLGRPCYFGLADTPSCTPRHWTSARYSQVVVDSLVQAIEHLRSPHQPLLLIGYSGGGTLAALAARRLDGDIRVITVAANLDTAAWTDLHGYLPLSESLNPIAERPTKPLQQDHLTGLQDRNTPPAIARSFSKKHGGTLREFPEFDHVCCWREHWPHILTSVLRSQPSFLENL